jgi:hypothetical protein
MSTLQEFETAITKLSKSELATLLVWFEKYDAVTLG